MVAKHVFNKGDLIEFEDGQYSDHSVWYPVRVLRKFNIREQAQKFLEENPKMQESYECDYYKFAAFLTRNGFIEETTNAVYRVWLGGYGKMEEPKNIGAN